MEINNNNCLPLLPLSGVYPELVEGERGLRVRLKITKYYN